MTMCWRLRVTPRGTLIREGVIEFIVMKKSVTNSSRWQPFATYKMTNSTSKTKTKLAWPDYQPRLLKNQNEVQQEVFSVDLHIYRLTEHVDAHS